MKLCSQLRAPHREPWPHSPSTRGPQPMSHPSPSLTMTHSCCQAGLDPSVLRDTGEARAAAGDNPFCCSGIVPFKPRR